MSSGVLLDFPRLIRATFVERPNRFTVRCWIGGKVQTAFLPNPGRLWEILLPGAPLFVVPREDAGQTGASRLPFVVTAARKGRRIVFLDTHRTNTVARWLIETSQVPELRGWRISGQEVRRGTSRFDFELIRGGDTRLLEVKSVTLFHRRVAMFPDAVTERGRRHLMELATVKQSRFPNCVLFLVHCDEIDYFMPDYHTDYRFARTMLELREQLEFAVASVRWNSRLVPSSGPPSIEIPWSYLTREVVDSGTLLLLAGPRSDAADSGSWAVAVGTVDKRMTAHEQSRALRRRIAVEFLQRPPEQCCFIPIPIRASTPCTGPIYRALRRTYGAPVTSEEGSHAYLSEFHVFRLDRPPLHDAAFVRILLDHRMRRPGH